MPLMLGELILQNQRVSPRACHKEHFFLSAEVYRVEAPVADKEVRLSLPRFLQLHELRQVPACAAREANLFFFASHNTTLK
ncbi:MAG: hypothetical protein NTW59_05170 [Candidatus Diapherotrites archaeon]|nr:hypothetical protein [Candidatus Diapherotrites archaeon]